MDEKIKKLKEWLGAGSINLFGRPFSGKDTQADILAKLLDGQVIGGGEILRSHEDAIPENVRLTYNNGGLAPTDFYLQLVPPYLAQPQFSNHPLLLSSIGRKHGEENAIVSAAEKAGHPIVAVINLIIEEDEVWKRFRVAQEDHDRGNRTDDSSEALRIRLEKFRSETIPVIEYYKQRGIELDIDGSLPRGVVTEKIIDTLLSRI